MRLLNFKRNNFKKALLYLSLLAISLISINILFSSKAHAFSRDDIIGPNLPGINSANIYGQTDNIQPWMAVGRNAYNGPDSWAKIYVPASYSGNVKLTIKRGGGTCGIDLSPPTVSYKVYNTVASNETLNNIVGTNDSTGGCADKAINFSNTGPTSAINGHTNYKVYMFVAFMPNIGSGDREKNFRLETSKGLVGYSKLNYSAEVGQFGIYMRDAPSRKNGGNNWNFALQYAPNCNASPVPAGHVGIYDADWGVYKQDALTSWVERANQGSGTFNGTVVAKIKPLDNPPHNNPPDDLGWHIGTGKPDSLDYTTSITSRYLLAFTDVNWHNTIQIDIPYDQVNAKVCVPQPNIKISCATDPSSETSDQFNANPNITVSVSNDGDTSVSGYQLRQIDPGGQVRNLPRLDPGDNIDVPNPSTGSPPTYTYSSWWGGDYGFAVFDGSGAGASRISDECWTRIKPSGGPNPVRAFYCEIILTSPSKITIRVTNDAQSTMQIPSNWILYRNTPSGRQLSGLGGISPGQSRDFDDTDTSASGTYDYWIGDPTNNWDNPDGIWDECSTELAPPSGSVSCTVAYGSQSGTNITVPTLASGTAIASGSVGVTVTNNSGNTYSGTISRTTPPPTITIGNPTGLPNGASAGPYNGVPGGYPAQSSSLTFTYTLSGSSSTCSITFNWGSAANPSCYFTEPGGTTAITSKSGNAGDQLKWDVHFKDASGKGVLFGRTPLSTTNSYKWYATDRSGDWDYSGVAGTVTWRYEIYNSYDSGSNTVSGDTGYGCSLTVTWNAVANPSCYFTEPGGTTAITSKSGNAGDWLPWDVHFQDASGKGVLFGRTPLSTTNSYKWYATDRSGDGDYSATAGTVTWRYEIYNSYDSASNTVSGDTGYGCSLTVTWNAVVNPSCYFTEPGTTTKITSKTGEAGTTLYWDVHFQDASGKGVLFGRTPLSTSSSYKWTATDRRSDWDNSATAGTLTWQYEIYNSYNSATNTVSGDTGYGCTLTLTWTSNPTAQLNVSCSQTSITNVNKGSGSSPVAFQIVITGSPGGPFANKTGSVADGDTWGPTSTFDLASGMWAHGSYTLDLQLKKPDNTYYSADTKTISGCMDISCGNFSTIDAAQGDQQKINGSVQINNKTAKQYPIGGTTSYWLKLTSSGTSGATTYADGTSGPEPPPQAYIVPGGPNPYKTDDWNVTINSTVTMTIELHYQGAATLFSCNSVPGRTSSRPFFQVWGGDLVSGGVFNNGTSCDTSSLSTNSGGIKSYGDPSGTFGSLSDLYVMSIGKVQNDGNSQNFGANSNGINHYFANTVTPKGLFYVKPSGASAAVCATDFYGTTQNSSPTPVDASSLNKFNAQDMYDLNPNSNSQWVHHGDLTLGDGTSFIPSSNGITNLKRTLYVDGNVNITGNIRYTDATSSFTLVVKGNINIAPSVTKLDGLYIAQPDTSNISGTGAFSTCNDGSGNSFCNQQLVVNGAVIAQHLYLQRSLGNLTSNGLCPAGTTRATHGNCPAEIFNYIPAMVITPPNFKVNKVQIQGLFNLPPVF